MKARMLKRHREAIKRREANGATALESARAQFARLADRERQEPKLPPVVVDFEATH